MKTDDLVSKLLARLDWVLAGSGVKVAMDPEVVANLVYSKVTTIRIIFKEVWKIKMTSFECSRRCEYHPRA